jgi:LemA protein
MDSNLSMESYIFLSVISVIVILFIVYVIKLYNLIINNKNAVTRSWSVVITQERQKSKILQPLEELVREYSGIEENVLSKITALRSSISGIDQSAPDTDSLLKVERMAEEVMKGLNVSVEAYPELKSSEMYVNLLNEISEQQEEVGAAIRIFNRNVEIMNNSIEEFPNSIVNSLFNKQVKIDSFSDSSSESGFEFKYHL